MLYQESMRSPQKPINKLQHYFPIYERHFGKFVNQSVTFWEIGVGRGGSVQMWKRYFGPFAKIIGIDINPERKQHEEEQISICIGDQTDTVFLQSIIDKHGQPDVVLDDGSHMAKHMCASFEYLYDKVSKNGVYMVEDLCCAYYDSYDGGLKREGTFIERAKDMIDHLNARHYYSGEEEMNFANSTYSMSFYDSVAVFEKINWTNDSWKAHLFKKMDYSIYLISTNKQIPTHELAGKKLIVFGAGGRGKSAYSGLKEDGISIEYYADNDENKQGRFLNGIKIISPEEAVEIPSRHFIISVDDKKEFNTISSQLKALGAEDEVLSGIAIS